MELNHKDGKLNVLYGDKLITLLREVRQFQALGFKIPGKVEECAKTGQKFYKHGIILKQVFKVLLKFVQVFHSKFFFF